jgi:hypothetical protein
MQQPSFKRFTGFTDGRSDATSLRLTRISAKQRLQRSVWPSTTRLSSLETLEGTLSVCKREKGKELMCKLFFFFERQKLESGLFGERKGSDSIVKHFFQKQFEELRDSIVQRVDQRMTELFEQHEKGMPQKDLLS